MDEQLTSRSQLKHCHPVCVIFLPVTRMLVKLGY